ncbi:MAG TPA: hypothetical protein VGM30_06120 [Puia sp.]
MLKLVVLFWSIFSFGGTKEAHFDIYKPGIDSVISNWNNKTYLSLIGQKMRTPDSTQKERYQNRLEGLRAYFDSNPTKANKSFRYRFLSGVLSDAIRKKKEFYVIETTNSEAEVLIRNFVVYPYSDNRVNVEVYVCGERGWTRQAEAKKLKCTILDGFERNYIRFAHGFNDDDLIITKFDKGEIKYSDFYLYGTLSISSGIKTILASDNKSNFVK